MLELKLLRTKPASVKEWLCVGAAIGAISLYLTYGANARQLCEFLTLTPAVFVTVQAADFLHDETIRKLITWHWAGKVLFLLGTPLLEHLTGFFFLEALHLCLLLAYIALKIETLKQRHPIFSSPPKQANNVKDVKVRNSESDKDTRDTTLSLAENCNTLVGSARIFTDPPSVLASEITLKEHYTKHDCIEDAFLESYTNELSQFTVHTATPWGDYSLYKRSGKAYDIVMGHILKQTPIEIRANGFHPYPQTLRLRNTLDVVIMFAIKADMLDGLDATPFCGIVEPSKSENIELSLPVGPCACNLSVDVVPLSDSAPQPTRFSRDLFFARTPISFPVRVHVE